MKKYLLTFSKFLISMILAITLLVKVTGNKFKTINPIPWKEVFNDYMTDIMIKSLILSVVFFIVYLFIENDTKG